MELVSIVMPTYNSASYISESITSVLQQTYQNWELIIVDDCSTDDTFEVVDKFRHSDSRILYYRTDVPSGSPTLPRNIAIEKARGRYIAFLDSDDLWLPQKIESQISIISDSNVAIAFSDYEKIDDNGIRDDRVVNSPSVVDYKRLLRGCCIGCLTVMFDTLKVGKLYMENIGAEDYHLWLQILKKGYIAKNTNSVMALYREREGSVSSNKVRAMMWTWNILKNKEKLPLFHALYYFTRYVISAILKRIK